MSAWTGEDLQRIRDAWEIGVACRRSDGTMHGPVALWHGVVDGDLYVRSARGTNTHWFTWAVQSRVGQIEVDGVSCDVRFCRAAPDVRTALDADLHDKYDRFGPHAVAAITGNDVHEFTLLVSPLTDTFR